MYLSQWDDTQRKADADFPLDTLGAANKLNIAFIEVKKTQVYCFYGSVVKKIVFLEAISIIELPFFDIASISRDTEHAAR